MRLKRFTYGEISLMISGRMLLVFSEIVFIANNYGTSVSYMILVSFKNSFDGKNVFANKKI